MTKFKTLFVAIFAAAFVMATGSIASMAHASPEGEVVTVYKQTWCGCCEAWAKYMRKAGYQVKIVNMDDLSPINARFGLPQNLAGCHTAVLGDYFISGHVPIADIVKLIAEKPDAGGISVPGMPMGSPGMEVPGRMPMKYNTLLITRDGTATVYVAH